MSTVMPSRRNVVRTAAWTVPVVAAGTAVPAYAASCGNTSYPWRLDWDNDQTSDQFTTSYPAAPTTNQQGVRTATATVTGPVGTNAMTVTFRSTMSGTDTRTNNNLRVDAATYPNVGATGGTGLLLQHQDITSGRANSYQQVEITFNRSVSNLRFTITDIDSNDQNGNGNDFWDRVELSGARTFTTTPRPGNNNGSYILGAGTLADPWRMYDQDVVAPDNNSNAGERRRALPRQRLGDHADLLDVARSGQPGRLAQRLHLRRLRVLTLSRLSGRESERPGSVDVLLPVLRHPVGRAGDRLVRRPALRVGESRTPHPDRAAKSQNQSSPGS